MYGKEPGMPYDYAWAVNEPDAGLNYGQETKLRFLLEILKINHILSIL